MVSGDLCKHLLHNCLILINLSKFSHVLQIFGEKPFISGNSRRRFALPICSIPSPHLGSRGGGGRSWAGAASGGRRLAGDLRGHILPALVRGRYEKFDLHGGRHAHQVGHPQQSGLDDLGVLASKAAIMASPCSQSTSIRSRVQSIASQSCLDSLLLRRSHWISYWIISSTSAWFFQASDQGHHEKLPHRSLKSYVDIYIKNSAQRKRHHPKI